MTKMFSIIVFIFVFQLSNCQVSDTLITLRSYKKHSENLKALKHVEMFKFYDEVIPHHKTGQPVETLRIHSTWWENRQHSNRSSFGYLYKDDYPIMVNIMQQILDGIKNNPNPDENTDLFYKFNTNLSVLAGYKTKRKSWRFYFWLNESWWETLCEANYEEFLKLHQFFKFEAITYANQKAGK